VARLSGRTSGSALCFSIVSVILNRAPTVAAHCCAMSAAGEEPLRLRDNTPCHSGHQPSLRRLGVQNPCSPSRCHSGPDCLQSGSGIPIRPWAVILRAAPPRPHPGCSLPAARRIPFYSSSQSSDRSRQPGLVDSINATFFLRTHPLICFSRAIADRTSLDDSKYTSFPTPYFLVNPSTNPSLCS